MADFQFLQNPFSQKWTILAPRRSKRPHEDRDRIPVCPFCVGQEKPEEEVFRLGDATNWDVRVITNKFPFAPVHEVIVHSPEHHKNMDELPVGQVEKIFQVYQDRFNLYKEKGTVYIFQNHGEGSGESIPHPHSQLVVVPHEITLDIAPLSLPDDTPVLTDSMQIFCPETSQWPDEVWIAPQKRNTSFGEIDKKALQDTAVTVRRVIQLLDMRHGHEFPFNYYVYPWKNWYIRIIPRQKILGAFELGTGVWVNTQDPKETLQFLREHFVSEDKEKIEREQRAQYHKHA